MISTFFMFEALLVAVLLALAAAPASIWMAKRFKLIDIPNSAPHKRHSHPTPLAGGIAMVLALLGAEAIFGTWADSTIRAAFLAGTLVFAFGLWDDFKSIPPWIKLSGQLLAAVALIRMGVYIRIFESPEFFLRGSEQFNLAADLALTLLWVVGITNAFNFVDSMDGLAVGLGGTAAAFFMLVTLDSQQQALSQHSAILIGVCLGLYLFNSPPALLFLGDSGAQPLGFILAVLAIAYRPLGANQSSSWFVPILLLGVPIFDACLVVFSRLWRGKPVYSAGRDHTYHCLLDMGMGPFRAVVVMQMAAMLLGCTAVILLTQPPLAANIAFGCLLLAGMGLIWFMARRSAPEI